MSGLDKPRGPETPRKSFDLSDTEEITLSTNGRAWLIFHDPKDANVDEIISVAGEDQNYNVRVLDTRPSEKLEKEKRNMFSDVDFLVELVKEQQ